MLAFPHDVFNYTSCLNSCTLAVAALALLGPATFDLSNEVKKLLVVSYQMLVDLSLSLYKGPLVFMKKSLLFQKCLPLTRWITHQ